MGSPGPVDRANPQCAGDHYCSTGKLPDAARQGLQFRKNVNHVIVTDADADAGADADAHVENRIQNVRKGFFQQFLYTSFSKVRYEIIATPYGVQGFKIFGKHYWKEVYFLM
jgi:hypothetical protein